MDYEYRIRMKVGKKILLVLALALIAIVVGGGVWFLSAFNKDVVSPVVTINPGGVDRALVVYQPGLSSGPRDASYAFTEGLASAGWRVEVTTASQEAPSDMSVYELLVLAFPIYGGQPGEAILRYVTRLGDLQGTGVAIINCNTPNAVMQAKVEAKGGTVVKNLAAGTANLRQEGGQIAP